MWVCPEQNRVVLTSFGEKNVIVQRKFFPGAPLRSLIRGPSFMFYNFTAQNSIIIFTMHGMAYLARAMRHDKP